MRDGSQFTCMLFHPRIDGGIPLDSAVESQQFRSHRFSTFFEIYGYVALYTRRPLACRALKNKRDIAVRGFAEIRSTVPHRDFRPFSRAGESNVRVARYPAGNKSKLDIKGGADDSDYYGTARLRGQLGHFRAGQVHRASAEGALVL
jgi:hypothetical protein